MGIASVFADPGALRLPHNTPYDLALGDYHAKYRSKVRLVNRLVVRIPANVEILRDESD
jgi:hypothetical protein